MSCRFEFVSMYNTYNHVGLSCLSERGKSSARAHHDPGYLHRQLPVSSRAARGGRIFKVSPSAVQLAAGPRGKYFYRVHGSIEVLGSAHEFADVTPQTVSVEHV